jgi:hypothetical protein
MNETNKLDRNNYARSYPRPLMAEVVVDVLGDALGVHEDFGVDAPPGKRAIEVASTKLLNDDLRYALRTFGRPDRNLPCDCERSTDPALAQTLYRMADPAVMHRIASAVVAAKVKGKPVPPSFANGRLAKLLASSKTEEEILEELFLATLSRVPTAAEKKHFADYRAARRPTLPTDKNLRKAALKKEREEVCTDALWALTNTREFILNH